MKTQTIKAVVMTAAMGLAMLGCNAKPVSVVDVDQSVMYPSAKSLLSQDASITRVQEETYSDGNKNQIIHYTLNGEEKQIKVSAKDHTSASGVFQKEKDGVKAKTEDSAAN